jgi:transglutaminase-like putative cysteine protease
MSPASPTIPARRVGCALELTVHGSARFALQVAVAEHQAATERMSVTLDGAPLPLRELTNRHGGRLHAADARSGRLVVEYEAVVEGSAPPQLLDEGEEFEYLRPSRYAPSDLVSNLAVAEFGNISDRREQLDAVQAWVVRRVRYELGSSRPTDSAIDTLQGGVGVCRDFAHLLVAVMRALDVPARVVACYAPGLSPMDFHAVAEVALDGAWRVVDPTLLAPRQSLVRISTGRDTADTAFLSSYGAQVELLSSTVFAFVDGELPRDELSNTVSMG